MTTLLGLDVDPRTADLPDQLNMDAKEQEKELKRLNSMHTTMMGQRSNYEAGWSDAADFLKPDMYYRTGKQYNNGRQSRARIVDTTPVFALRTMVSGLYSGTSNPSRSWFNIMHPDPEMNDIQAVKEWTADTKERMQNVMLRSNLYKVLPKFYASLGIFGIGAMVVVDDFEDVIRFHHVNVGQFWVANDERGNIGTYIEEQQWTVEQLVNMFGLNAVSTNVKNKYTKGQTQDSVKVCWCIEKNRDYEPASALPEHRKYRQTYWEKGKSDKGLLSISGSDYFNVIVARWETDTNDPYGIGPGVEAVPDFKSLSLAEKQLQLARELNVKPPWILDPELQGQQKLFIPGGYIYSTNKEGAVPAFKAHLDESGTRETIRQYQDRIQRFFFVDLFLMVANEDRSNVTATEIQARQQERMLALGPVLQALNDEAFDQLIDLVFDAMDRRGLIPEPPEELDGVKLRVEYISILAQAQKASDVTALDRYVGSVLNLAGGDPADPVLDNLPKDDIARLYHELLGQHPDAIASEEELGAKRQARAEQAQQAQQMEAMGSVAQTAKTLSETSLDDTNALAQVLGANV